MSSDGFIDIIQKLIDRIDQLQSRLINCETTLNILSNNLGHDPLNLAQNLPKNRSELLQIINNSLVEREKKMFDRVNLLPEIQDLVKAGIIICGPPGKEGPQGRIGPIGPPGQRGLPGQQGAPGPDGHPGRNGLDGLNGINGQNGTDGLMGAKGIPGEQGPRGKKGPVGGINWSDIEPNVKKLVNDYLHELLKI